MSINVRPEWHQQAACRDHEFRRGEIDPWHPDGDRQRVRDAVTYAKAVCHGCPVRAECLDEALAEKAQYGIRGGLTAPERVRLRLYGTTEIKTKRGGKRTPRTPRAKREPAPCGTRAAYTRHRRNGETPDQACIDANAEYMRRQREAGAYR